MKGTQHVNFAMREVDHADNAIDHGVTDRDEAINGAKRQSIDQLL